MLVNVTFKGLSASRCEGEENQRVLDRMENVDLENLAIKFAQGSRRSRRELQQGRNNCINNRRDLCLPLIGGHERNVKRSQDLFLVKQKTKERRRIRLDDISNVPIGPAFPR